MNIKDKLGLTIEIIESLQADYDELGLYDEIEELENMRWELIYQFECDHG